MTQIVVYRSGVSTCKHIVNTNLPAYSYRAMLILLRIYSYVMHDFLWGCVLPLGVRFQLLLMKIIYTKTEDKVLRILIHMATSIGVIAAAHIPL